MKLLLDEMFPAAIARALREDGYDVVAVQEDSDLRESSDPALFATAQRIERTIVTENVKDFMPLAAESHAHAQPHWGLVFTTNQSFPRHHDRFIGAMIRALCALLDDETRHIAVSAIHWLRAPPTEEY
ncbi:MAG: DUF5615 family PIN-like protein [Actinomycetota bacterium]|nr:DUF5615 family PIN-like protein [Actinomycetota bacterium]